MIETMYQKHKSTKSDINEHLETLRVLSADKSVVEIGVREVVSTWAFLMGGPKSLRSFDLYRSNNVSKAEDAAAKANIDFRFTTGSSLEADIPDCDLLFIDTWHNYHHLKLELNRLHRVARERIVLHDTVTFAHRSEVSTNGRKPLDIEAPNDLGLWDALEEFLAEHPEWEIESHYKNNNGLTVLVRND